MKAGGSEINKILKGTIGRFALMACLIAIIIMEAYYIYILREKINSQTEDIKIISARMQSLKSERENLKGEISAVQDSNGDRKYGSTAKGQH